jgi:hypothetical protein
VERPQKEAHTLWSFSEKPGLVGSAYWQAWCPALPGMVQVAPAKVWVGPQTLHELKECSFEIRGPFPASCLPLWHLPGGQEPGLSRVQM